MTVTPILFSAPMIRALLREVEAPGTGKRQTRRLAWQDRKDPADDNLTIRVRSPWMKLHDRWAAGERDVVIWVRETFRLRADQDHKPPSEDWWKSSAWYEADGVEPSGCGGGAGKVRQSIHMPRWASRLTLVVTDMRMERLQDISDNAALAEGVTMDGAIAGQDFNIDGEWWPGGPRRLFSALWNSIHGAGAWEANPEVIAVTFQPLAVNVDQHLREHADGR